MIQFDRLHTKLTPNVCVFAAHESYRMYRFTRAASSRSTGSAWGSAEERRRTDGAGGESSAGLGDRPNSPGAPGSREAPALAGSGSRAPPWQSVCRAACTEADRAVPLALILKDTKRPPATGALEAAPPCA